MEINWKIGTQSYIIMGGKLRKATLISINQTAQMTQWKPINQYKKTQWIPFGHPHIYPIETKSNA